MGEEDNRMTMPADFMLIAGALVLLSVIAALRAVLGKTSPDRVVAVDTMGTLAVAALVCAGAALAEVIYIDVALVYALLSFVGTVFISKQLEERK